MKKKSFLKCAVWKMKKNKNKKKSLLNRERTLYGRGKKLGITEDRYIKKNGKIK